jgi:hypothetical protein
VKKGIEDRYMPFILQNEEQNGRVNAVTAVTAVTAKSHFKIIFLEF